MCSYRGLYKLEKEENSIHKMKFCFNCNELISVYNTTKYCPYCNKEWDSIHDKVN